MIKINDIRPGTFGGGHLGVNGTPNGGFDYNSITPFGNVHHLSGIYHVSFMVGAVSGIIRYSQPEREFQISNDGGITFSKLLVGYGLQEAYDNFPAIIAKVGVGLNLGIIVKDGKFQVSSVGSRAPFNLSGVIPFEITQALGNLSFHPHGQNINPPATNLNEIKARALGPGSLFINTGSGVINTRIGSGICQFQSITAQNIAPAGGTNISLEEEDISDLNFAHSNVTNPSFISINAPGFYRCAYSFSFDRTAGTNRIQVRTSARLNNGAEISRSSAYTYLRALQYGEDTAAAEFYFNANAGDFINIKGVRGFGDASNTAAIIANESWIILERIGPKRVG